MKEAELLHGYLITTKPTNDNAGKCIWAFAEKDGKEYFVKEFLEPKRPRPESMGTPADKQALLKLCEEFEERNRSVIKRIDPRDLDAGNLVMAVDFFCEGTRYYKVTERLYPAELAAPHKLTPHQKCVLLGTLADSLQLLHRLGIVHGDLKPQNVLLHRPEGSDFYTAKLIDFDDSYISGDPPGREDIGGDAFYGAPEWLRYVNGDPATGSDQLTTAVDMFAFGLLLHTYLSGSLPGYEQRFSSPAEAVNKGSVLHLDERIHKRLASTVRSLTSRDPTARPAVGEILELLNDRSLLTLGAAECTPENTRPRGSRLRVNVAAKSSVNSAASPEKHVEMRTDALSDSIARDAESAPTSATPVTRRSRLRINLDGREADRTR